MNPDIPENPLEMLPVAVAVILIGLIIWLALR